MLAFTIFVVFLLGLLSGLILTVLIAVFIEERDDRKMRKAVQKERAHAMKNGPILI